MHKNPSTPSPLRGAARLATDATTGLVDLVEAMHAGITSLPGLPAPADSRTRGITGLVYQTIRGVTRLAGGSIDALLGVLAPALATREAGPRQQALLAALNGVLGDHLEATGNPLATPMTLRRNGLALRLDRGALAALLPGIGQRPLVLVHGLCMNDLQWSRAGHDHGAALACALGFTPLYLRYNSGLHVSANGRALAEQLERLLAAWPLPVQGLALLGHSMGGLLIRSALHYGALAGHAWPSHTTHAVFLGTPHHGAPLERAGNWVEPILGATPYAKPFARLTRLRSAGITDLRHGNLLDEDWQGISRFSRTADQRVPVPLPAHVACFALAATTGQTEGDLKGRLLGDGLVPLDSALGRHAEAARSLAFAPEQQWVSHGVNHMELLGRPEVMTQLLRWLV